MVERSNCRLPLRRRYAGWTLASAFGGHTLFRAAFRALPARAGNVSAGAEIVVLAQTIGAEMHLVDFTIDHGYVSANIAAAAAFAWRRFTLPGGLQQAGFQKYSRRRNQKSHGNHARAQTQQRGFHMFAHGRHADCQSDQHRQRAK